MERNVTELIVLIDPDDLNLDKLIQEINTARPEQVWIGCSTSSGVEVAAVFDRLEVRASLYPGNVEQICAAHEPAKQVYLPDPLIYANRHIVERLKSQTIDFIGSGRTDPGKYSCMHYVLLHPHCTTAKIIGLDEIPSDQEVLDLLAAQEERHPYIYLEGGSRNEIAPITERMGLITEIRARYEDVKIICAGGISTPSQVGELRGHCDYVLVSHALHKSPERLGEYQVAIDSQVIHSVNHVVYCPVMCSIPGLVLSGLPFRALGQGGNRTIC